MKRIYVIKERCNGCMSCVVACQKSHSDSELYAPIRDTEPNRIFIQAVDKSPVPLVCRHCEEPACVKACMSGAMRKDEVTGIVSNEYDPNKCVGCWMCVMACPFGVISPKQDGNRKVAVKCDLCMKRGYPACVESCPKGAIVYMEDEEFAEYKRQMAAENEAFAAVDDCDSSIESAVLSSIGDAGGNCSGGKTSGHWHSTSKNSHTACHHDGCGSHSRGGDH